MQFKLRVRLIRGANPGNREQFSLTVRESKTLCVEQGLIGPVTRYRPLQRFVPRQPLVVNAGEHRSKSRNFVHDLGRVFIMPVRTQLVGNALRDLPIWAATLKRFKNLVESLNAPLRTGKGAFLFEARCYGQYNIGKPAGVC